MFVKDEKKELFNEGIDKKATKERPEKVAIERPVINPGCS